MARRALIVEDSSKIAQTVASRLAELGFEPDIATSGVGGLAKAMSGQHEILILDRMLPDMDGLEICRKVRAEGSTVPVLMISAKSEEDDKVGGLEVGADDYITKPFSVRELVARIQAVLRRVEMESSEPVQSPTKISAGGLSIDIDKRVIDVEGTEVNLTAREFDLLVQFASNPGRVYTRGQLLDLVWGYSHGGYEHTVNSHMNRLRSKIEPDPSVPKYILTIWGVGYKFNDRLDG
jgi:DNA-binding response OmpR family regulator